MLFYTHCHLHFVSIYSVYFERFSPSAQVGLQLRCTHTHACYINALHSLHLVYTCEVCMCDVVLPVLLPVPLPGLMHMVAHLHSCLVRGVYF